MFALENYFSKAYYCFNHVTSYTSILTHYFSSKPTHKEFLSNRRRSLIIKLKHNYLYYKHTFLYLLSILYFKHYLLTIRTY